MCETTEQKKTIKLKCIYCTLAIKLRSKYTIKPKMLKRERQKPEVSQLPMIAMTQK